MRCGTAAAEAISTTASNRVLKIVLNAGKTRHNPTIKRRLSVINEHFEEDFDAALPSAAVFQHPLRAYSTLRP